MTRQARAALFLLLSVLWMCVIFAFSAANSVDSAALSGTALKKLLSFTVPRWEQLSAGRQADIVHALHRGFRKCGHLSEYAILGALLTATVRYIKQSRLIFPNAEYWLPALLSLLYAFSDELHQRFVSGRSAELQDVLIDLAGATIGILLMHLLVLLVRRRREHKLLHTTANA